MNQPKDYADRSGLLKTDTGDHQKSWDWVEKLAIYALFGLACFWLGVWVGS